MAAHYRPDHRNGTKESSLLGAFCTILGACLLAVLDALKVKRTTHNVVANTGQVLDTTTAHEHDGVFLKVVAFTTDVRNDFVAVGQTHLGDFAQGRVGLFGSRGVHAGAYTAALRAVFKRGAFAAGATDCARLAQKLTDSWHDLYASF